jgi:hypothetical protein
MCFFRHRVKYKSTIKLQISNMRNLNVQLSLSKWSGI